jgi:DNA polymerase-3 subunit epsilon
MLFSSPPWDSVVYWALDLETGGLDARTDALLAVGMVPLRAQTVRVGEAYYSLVRPEEGARIDPGSVRAHQLVEEELRAAPPLADVLPEIARRLAEGVLLVHHRAIDVAFLTRAFARAGLRWPAPQVVDTVDLLLASAGRARRRRPELPRELATLNLAAARRDKGLPAHLEHDALSDAIAAAELFLVLRAELGARTLRDLRPSLGRFFR